MTAQSRFPLREPSVATRAPILSEAAIAALESSFALLAPRAPELVRRFYARLFREHPALRPMFPEDMADQQQKLVGAIALVVGAVRKLDTIEPALQKLGKRHESWGVAPEQYAVVGGLLLETMADMAEAAWTHDVETAWKTAYGWVAGTMNGTYGEKKNMNEHSGLRNGTSEIPRPKSVFADQAARTGGRAPASPSFTKSPVTKK